MNKTEFSKLNTADKVKYLNERLSEGQTVKRIREDLNISEKKLQNQIRKGRYKYNQKLKQYIKVAGNTTQTTTSGVVAQNTSVAAKEYISENIDVLKEIIEKYKITKTTTSTGIVIDLISDKHLNPKPHSLRINEFIWQEWQEFCDKNKHYSKQDLLSMALKLYMERYSDLK